MALQIIPAGSAMGQSPVAAENSCGAIRFVDDGVHGKSRRNKFGNALTLVIYGIPFEQSRPDTGLSPAAFKIKRRHVRCFDRLPRGEPRTDRFATPCESREVMKSDPAD